jgi:hypothetical protein
MSKYTSIILIIPGVENENERITEVNSFEIKPGIKLNLWDINDTKKYPDIFPRFTYVGTYNFFDTEKFLQHLQTVNWEFPEYIQVLIQEEDAFTCKIYSNAGAKLEVDSVKI